MKTKVEEYKGFDISFDTDKEHFIVEGEDNRTEKRSYSACKKYINEFIKTNDLFGEFEVVRLPNHRRSFLSNEWLLHPVKIKGIHANGNFLCEKFDGEKFQMGSHYDFEKFCLPSDLAESDYKQEVVDAIETQISALHEEIRAEEKKLPKTIESLMAKVKQENLHLWKK